MTACHAPCLSTARGQAYAGSATTLAVKLDRRMIVKKV